MRSADRGFTLVETVLSLALLLILVGIMAPVTLPLLRENDLDVAVTHTVEGLRRAQTLSQAGVGDSAWGVKMLTSSITVFKGNSYASRISGYDEVTTFSPQVTTTGLNEIVFSRLYGMPNATGIITITSYDNVHHQITINSQGALTY